MLQPPEPHSPFLGSNVLLSVRGYSVCLHRVPQVFATAGLLLGKRRAQTRSPLVLLSVVKFLSRKMICILMHS